MSSEGIAAEPHSSLDDIDFTITPDDLRYGVGAMTDKDLFHLSGNTMNQAS